MNNLNKTQKIIITIIAIILILGICYYIYFKDERDINIIEDNSLEIEEVQEETQDEEEYSDTRIIVYITGAINKEGIYELPVNSRISDLIEKAEGIKEEAYIEKLNLAYKLEDGMKIHIPTKQEYEEQQKIKQETNITEDVTNEYITTDSGISSIEKDKEDINSENTNNDKININKATQTELDSLPGIGPSTAEKIIEYRKEKGKFKKIEEIKEVSGIGEAKYEKIKDKIEV